MLGWKPEVTSGEQVRLPSGLELRFDVHETVVLGDSLPTAWGPRFQMTSLDTDGKVRDKVIGCLSRTVRDENAPSKTLCKIRPAS